VFGDGRSKFKIAWTRKKGRQSGRLNKGNHPGWVAARANKEEMRARLATIVAKLGVGNPNRVASQIALMINGAYVTGLVAKPADLRCELVDAAMKLLA
jgi:hypothetical protein